MTDLWPLCENKAIRAIVFSANSLSLRGLTQERFELCELNEVNGARSTHYSGQH